MDPPSDVTPDVPSSDDDPHRFIGQVTPHRLISPALRRAKVVDNFDNESGSDDSNMSASPTADRVVRMSQGRTKRRMRASPRNDRLMSCIPAAGVTR